MYIDNITILERMRNRLAIDPNFPAFGSALDVKREQLSITIPETGQHFLIQSIGG